MLVIIWHPCSKTYVLQIWYSKTVKWHGRYMSTARNSWISKTRKVKGSHSTGIRSMQKGKTKSRKKLRICKPTIEKPFSICFTSTYHILSAIANYLNGEMVFCFLEPLEVYWNKAESQFLKKSFIKDSKSHTTQNDFCCMGANYLCLL